MAKGKKYWEVESPVEIKSEKNVVKVYEENGKVQVFPRVEGTPHGIGKGATIDLEAMEVDELMQLKTAIEKAISNQLTTEMTEEVG